MAAKITHPDTQTVDAPREHGGFRLDGRLLVLIEDIALGIEEGEAGLKSCAMGAVSAASAGANAAQVNATHHLELAVIEDEDECFNAIGDLLAKGFTHGEVAKMVTLGGGATHLLALERWCDRIRLECTVDHEGEQFEGVPWHGSALHERRRRANAAMALLQSMPEGRAHAAVLHIVYGHPDPMLLAAKKFIFDQETALAGEPPPKLDPADRDVFNLAKLLLDMGELAPLARYTDAVEAKRLAMAKAEALAPSTRKYIAAPTKDIGRAWRGVDTQADEIRRDGTFNPATLRFDEDSRVQSGSEAARAAIAMGLQAEQRCAGVVDLNRHRERQRWAESVLSSTDALRAAIARPAPKREDETRAEYDARFEAAKTERVVFLSLVRSDANRLLTDASHAFHAAWLRS